MKRKHVLFGAVLTVVLLLGAGTAAAAPTDDRAVGIQSDVVVSDAPTESFLASTLQEDGQGEDNETGQAEDNETQEDDASADAEADAEQEEAAAGQEEEPGAGELGDAVPFAEGWHSMTFSREAQRHTIAWKAPVTPGPEAPHGHLFLRVLDQDGNELVTFDGETEVVPGGREFGFQAGTNARVRGGVVITESETAGEALLAIELRGDNLSPGEEYELLIKDPEGREEVLTAVADERGRLSAEAGPVPTRLAPNETDLTITVEGPEFDETTGVSPAGEAAEEEPAEPFIVEGDDVVMTIFSPPIFAEGGEVEIPLAGGEVNEFSVRVTDLEGNVSQNVTVEWQLHLNGLAQQPFVEAERDEELAEIRRQLEENQRLLETVLNRTAPADEAEAPEAPADENVTEEEQVGVDEPDEAVRTLTIESTGPQATYAFTVSGELAKSTAMDATVNEFDVVEDDSAAGVVSDAGRDSYEFTGDVTSFTADGEVTLYLDGEQITEDELTGNATDVGATEEGAPAEG